jgi:hypothetical protein
MSNDLIYCNNCLKLSSNGMQFYLTECSIIYCQKCIHLFKNNCIKCSPNVCQSIQLNNSTKPEIQLLFKDLSNSFKKLEKVITFQKNQRIRLINKLFDENKRLENEIISQKQLINELQNENNLLKENFQNKNNSIFSSNQIQVKEDSKQSFGQFFDFGNKRQFNSINDNFCGNCF